LAAPQLGRGLTGSRELLLQGNRAIEDVLDQLGRHADGISEALCEIEHQTIGGLGSCRQRLLGTISLRDRFLLRALSQHPGGRCTTS
jgi:hypothetical protein